MRPWILLVMPERWRKAPPARQDKQPKHGIAENDDGSERSKVRKPEPEHIDPLPLEDVANNDEYEAADNERDNTDMQGEHHIRKQLIGRPVAHLRCLTRLTKNPNLREHAGVLKVL